MDTRRIFLAGLFMAWLPLFFGGCSQPFAFPPPSPANPAGFSGDSASLGRALIRIADTPAVRTLYPVIPPFTFYTLNFVHDDGETVPDAIMEEEESLVVELKTGIWTITATAFIDSPGGDGSLPLFQGHTRISVEAGEPVFADICLDKPLTSETEAGRFSYTVKFPRDRVSSAVLSLSALGDTGTFIPVENIDLLAEASEIGLSDGSISLPAGYYRMDIRLSAVYPFAGKTEILHIYPGLETVAPPWSFTSEDIPSTVEITGTVALKEYLDSLPPNTAKTPYPVKLTGVDLGSVEKTGETLRTLCAALSRFTALDLRGCQGTIIEAMSKTIAPNKGMIVSIILPDTVTSIGVSGFFGYDSLVSVELPKVITLDKGAFKDCLRLESVYMPELKTLTAGTGSDNGVFRGCAALKTVVIPKVEDIGDYAFYKCGALTALFLPVATSVGKSAFRYGDVLSTVFLPKAAFIGNYAFADCPRLSSFTLGDLPPVLEGKNIFPKDTLPRNILVPASVVDVYKNTAQENWTEALKERISAIPY
jgi:hypothetical protein